MKIIIKCLLLVSFVIGKNNYYHCGFTSGNNEIREARPIFLSDEDEFDAFIDIELFRIHYNTTFTNTTENNSPEQGYGDSIQIYPDDDDNGIPDYIDALGEAANYSYNFIRYDLGYQNAELIISDCDSNSGCEDRGGSSLYDIYVNDREAASETINGTRTEYGSNVADVDIGSGPVTSFIFIDNGMTEIDYHTHGIDAMKTTIAHEFFVSDPSTYYSTYFYEMSSAWIEDIIYPDINDYVAYGWTKSFFDYPNMKDDIDQTNGYSIALYAHYLTSKKIADNNSIIKDMWTQFESIDDPIICIDNVLLPLSTNFIETWVDFCSLNFFNGFYPDMNNEFYYHPDQVEFAQPMTIYSEDPPHSPLDGSPTNWFNSNMSFSEILLTGKNIDLIPIK